MTWSNPQKANVVRACKAIGREEMREVILRQLGGRAEHPQGSDRITSTSPRLTQRDYEQTMLLIEQYSGGQIQTKTKDGQHVYSFGHWQRGVDFGTWKRMRHRAQELADDVAASIGPAYAVGVINAALGLDGRKALASDTDLDNCDERQLAKAIDALTAIALRDGSNTVKPREYADAR